MKLPERKDFLDYAESSSAQDPELQKQILRLLASSQEYREQMAELKKDLYMIEVQIPEYPLRASFAADLARVSKEWIDLRFAREFSFKNFHTTKEFLWILLGMALGISSLYLLLWFL